MSAAPGPRTPLASLVALRIFEPPRTPARRSASLTTRPLVTVALLAFLPSCGAGSATPRRVPRGSQVGVDPVPEVRLIENHSDALIAWRRAGVRDRILVHIDGHSDLDWLPDATIATLAAAEPAELEKLEVGPYTLDGSTHRRFGIWNFVYPAVRLGIVREYVWVVPDGTLVDAAAAQELVRRLILSKMQRIDLDEARTLRFESRRVRGTLLGVPVTICELADLPSFDEPVLLDVDLDFLTTRSGTTQEVTPRPWITPEQMVARLRDTGLRADLATLSYSTMGGFLPPACRWVGPAMRDALARVPAGAPDPWAAHIAAEAAALADPAATHPWRDLVDRFPDDAAAWYALARAEERAGDATDAEDARRRAVALDPVLADAELFEADALWMNGDYALALDAYRSYRRERPRGPYLAYGLRREAGCLARLGKDDDAIATLRRVVVLAPDHADTRLDLAVLLRSRGDLAGAVAELQTARRILPDQGTYALALGTTYAQLGRLDDALEQVEAAVALRPSWAQAQQNLGALLAAAGRPTEAGPHVQAAAALEPGRAAVDRAAAGARGAPDGTVPVVAHPPGPR